MAPGNHNHDFMPHGAVPDVSHQSIQPGCSRCPYTCLLRDKHNTCQKGNFFRKAFEDEQTRGPKTCDPGINRPASTQLQPLTVAVDDRPGEEKSSAPRLPREDRACSQAEHNLHYYRIVIRSALLRVGASNGRFRWMDHARPATVILPAARVTSKGGGSDSATHHKCRLW
jgi:hypothetical protein